MIVENALNYRQEVIALLKSEKLPAEDLPEKLDNFLAIRHEGHLVAAAGVEQYGSYALLRSVVVLSDFRNRGVAGKLLAAIEELALNKGIKTVYLLTETAPEYFSRKGYQQIGRNSIPVEVQKSSEFSHVCPQSAVVMRKVIADNQ
ncbi:MAG TPA: arsenic resistance N-acetyltransferase ArsN2 [Mucilaginibacter sp.]|jgi:amino-acid N-acetyltransferase